MKSLQPANKAMRVDIEEKEARSAMRTVETAAAKGPRTGRNSPRPEMTAKRREKEVRYGTRDKDPEPLANG